MIGAAWALARLLRSQHWDAARIARYQEQRLVATMRHAVTHVPFYRSLGLAADELRATTDLARFPVLRKADVQRLGAALHAEDVAAARCHVSRTSGSTGQPTETWFCAASWSLLTGPVKWRRSLTGGLALPERVLVVGEQPQPRADAAPRAIAAAMLPLSVARLSVHEPWPVQLERVRRTRPTMAYAYPSWYLEFLDHCEAQGATVPRIRRLFTSAERLTDAARARLERAFGGRVYDVYGSTEFKEVAAECEHGRRHLVFETTHVEALPLAGAATSSELVLTTLVNRAMPLLRYALGDLGEVVRGNCPCGRHSPWIEGLRGRTVEALECADGSRVSPYVVSTLVEDHPAIARYQLLQAGPGRLQVHYSRRAGRDEPVPGVALQQALDTALAGRCSVEFEPRQQLQRGATGKHRLLIRAPDPGEHDASPGATATQ